MCFTGASNAVGATDSGVRHRCALRNEPEVHSACRSEADWQQNHCVQDLASCHQNDVARESAVPDRMCSRGCPGSWCMVACAMVMSQCADFTSAKVERNLALGDLACRRAACQVQRPLGPILSAVWLLDQRTTTPRVPGTACDTGHTRLAIPPCCGYPGVIGFAIITVPTMRFAEPHSDGRTRGGRARNVAAS